ncbi:GntR family transcriptional regulator [Allopusillimonas ginsengisoli]|nr:GntR family transcriptional regulator [Allopusillimonas ginsengisoli]
MPPFDSPLEANLRSSVLQRIRLEIVSGKTRPGEILTVPTLAKAWGSSTTPVREALLELSNQGLLEPLRNRGFRVCIPTAEDLKNLFAIRVQLEGYAITSVDNISENAVAELRLHAQEIADAVTARDTFKYLAADRAFHYTLISLAGNERLTKMIMNLRDNMRLYGIESPAGMERQALSVDEHFQLVDVIISGDKQRALSLMKTHILDWEPIFLDAIEADL